MKKYLISAAILLALPFAQPTFSAESNSQGGGGRCMYYSCGTCGDGTVMMCTDVRGCPVNMCSDITLPSKPPAAPGRLERVKPNRPKAPENYTRK